MSTMSSGTGMVADALGNGAERIQNSMASFSTSSGYFKDGSSNDGGKSYQHDKLSGK